jgi:hypothetical protein
MVTLNLLWMDEMFKNLCHENRIELGLERARPASPTRNATGGK